MYQIQPRLTFLRNELTTQLRESQTILDLLGAIEARENKRATADEIVQIKTFQASDACEVFSDDVIALILESKSSQRLKKNELSAIFIQTNHRTLGIF